MNEPIKLRWKKLESGIESAFLDITIQGRKRTKEYLKIYRGGSVGKKESKESERLALAIQQKRLKDYNLMREGVEFPRCHRLFLDFFEECKNANNHKEASRAIWKSTKTHMMNYMNKLRIDESCFTIKDVTPDFCIGFLDYLKNEARPLSITNAKGATMHKKYYSLTNLSTNTVNIFFSKLKACIHIAIEKQLIRDDPTVAAGRMQHEIIRREFLDIEEVRLLMRTEYTDDVICRAFLFSCMTGLRLSDIRNMKWSQVEQVNGQWRVVLSQQKTMRLLYLDISDLAYYYLGERNANERVFYNLGRSSEILGKLRKWFDKAGIKKRLSFHCARHTAAVSMITSGVDIFTVSKILGHSNISTTQIYADVINDKKKDAINKIADMFGGTKEGQKESIIC